MISSAGTSTVARRRFHPHDTARIHGLTGLPLATFWQRVLGYVVDLLIAVAIWGPLEFAWSRFLLHEENIKLVWDFHEKGNIVVMILYWGFATYLGNGRTPGKWVARTRIYSLTGERMGLWQSLERALGYGAGSRRRARLRSVFLGPEPDVRARSPGRDHCGGPKKEIPRRPVRIAASFRASGLGASPRFRWPLRQPGLDSVRRRVLLRASLRGK